MIRHYCDACGNEIVEELDLAQSLVFEVEPSPLDKHNSGAWPRNPIQVKTLRAVDGTWNGGDVCRNCLVRVITEGHERRNGTVARA